MVHQLIADHRVVAADQDRQRGQVSERGRLGQDHRRVEQASEQPLQLHVGGARDVHAGRRELDAVARDRVDRRGFEAQVRLETDVRAGAEVHLAPAAYSDEASAELQVLRGQVADAAGNALANRGVDQSQARVDRPVLVVDRCPAWTTRGEVSAGEPGTASSQLRP